MGDLSKNFSRAEFRCKCGKCSQDTVDAELLMALQDVADHFRAPVTISSANRCEAHNRKVGGAPTSQHLYGRAADINVKGHSPSEVADYLESKYPTKYGIGRYTVFTHLDTRTGRSRFDMRK